MRAPVHTSRSAHLLALGQTREVGTAQNSASSTKAQVENLVRVRHVASVRGSDASSLNGVSKGVCGATSSSGTLCAQFRVKRRKSPK